MSGRLAGKVALVTGGATGIGRATAQLYAEEGAKVVVGDIRPDEAEQTIASIGEAGGLATFVPADVTSNTDVAALVAAAEREYGRLDVVTANAGILGRNASEGLLGMPEADFARVIDVNFYGVVNVFRHAIPALRRAGGGALTATTSLAAHRGVRKMDAYTASKAAVTGLVRSLAVDLAPVIRINAVAPGAVRTEIFQHAAELNEADVVTAPDRQTVPVAEPRQIAFAHLFLVSDEASFVTGQVLCVDGGRSIVDVSSVIDL